MTRVMILALSKHLSMEIDVHSILSVGWACGNYPAFVEMLMISVETQ